MFHYITVDNDSKYWLNFSDVTTKEMAGIVHVIGEYPTTCHLEAISDANSWHVKISNPNHNAGINGIIDLSITLTKLIEKKDEYTVNDIAKLTGTHSDTVRRWIREGRLISNAKKGKNHIITYETLDIFLKANPKYRKRAERYGGVV